MKKVKVTCFDKFMLLAVAYGGFGFSLYSFIQKSTYTKDLLSPVISILLSVLMVIAVHHWMKKHRQPLNKN